MNQKAGIFNLKNKFSSEEEFEEYVYYKFQICKLNLELNEARHELVCLKRGLLRCKDNLKLC